MAIAVPLDAVRETGKIKAMEREQTMARHGLNLRLVAIALNAFAFSFWLLFAILNFPLFAAPDSDSRIERAYEHASETGFVLALLSFTSQFLCIGAFGRGLENRIIAGLHIAAIAVASVWLYSPNEPSLGALRSPTQVLGIIAVLLAVWVCELNRRRSPKALEGRRVVGSLSVHGFGPRIVRSPKPNKRRR